MNVVNFGSLNIDHVYAVDHFCRAGETIHTKSYTCLLYTSDAADE